VRIYLSSVNDEQANTKTGNDMLNQYTNNRPIEEDVGRVEIAPPVRVMPESLIQIVWHSRWIVLLALIVVLVAAFTYIFKATPIYTSTSRIYVEQTGPKIITEIEQGVMTQSKNYLYTQAELLKSTPILAAALDKPGIRELKTFDRITNQIGYLKKTLDATVGKKDDIISLSFDSPDPVEAARLVNAVVDSYVTYHATRKRSTSAEVLKILQSEKVKRSQELSERLKVMMDFKKENIGLAFESNRGNVILERLDRLSVVLTEAQLATIESRSAYESTEKMVSDPIMLKQFVEAQRSRGVYVSRSNEETELKSRLEQLQLRRSDRLREVKPDHPAVKAIDSEIAQVENRIADLATEFAQAQLQVAEQQYLAAKEKEEQIAKYFEEQRQQVVQLNEQLAQYTILQSEWEQTKKLCDILDDRIKELNVTEDVGALNISILEVARPATTPSKPQKARIMGIALVLGLVLGGGLALLRDWMDQRLRSAAEISAILGVPMLGVVPSMSRRQTAVARGQKVHLESTSSAAEAYRTIRTSVFFSVPKGEGKTILISSPGAGDGKTTLVSNLAITMAQAGQRILVLDADFRKPMQHEIFEVRKEPGLSNVLAGMHTLGESIQHSAIDDLAVLACGQDVANPSEMLNSEAFADIMVELSKKYDRIVVDSPPVMPVTDACILGAICDVTLLVLRAEKSTRKAAQQARDGLLSVGAHLLGTVVNNVPRSKGRYGYYYYGYGYYGYRYGYGRKKKKRESEMKVIPRAAANPGESDV
jgi:succinoglycan biosynthesis transport protein ExoP